LENEPSVRTKGLEPSRELPHWNLNPARLPIPPCPRGASEGSTSPSRITATTSSIDAVKRAAMLGLLALACTRDASAPRSLDAIRRDGNHLVGEPSPYLEQHAHNPVDWYPWDDAALARAKRENKPIFLSIGYSTCHWCHVMEKESFEDDETARFLNEHFVSIKVDREERPDVDQIYMTFVQAMSGQGGWPLNVFLTPELKPFYGGTYFPPDARYGRPSFPQVLQNI